MRNRSSLLTISILSLLIGVSFFLYKFKNKNSTLDKEARDFKVEDTASITRIFLVNKNGTQSTVERTKNGWIVNSKYPCRAEAIETLLYTIKMVDVKSPVPKAAKQNIIKQMIANSVKVEIYKGSELIKQYYVGRENQEHDGTYMVLTDIDSGENFDEPYLNHIPGFDGFLSSRYIVSESEWRDKTVFNYIPPQISQIKVENLERPDSSFIIKLNSTTSFELKKLDGSPLPFEEIKMKQYLAYFQNLQYEGIFTSANKHLTDSLNTALPFYRISVTDKDGKINSVSFIHKNSTPELNEKYGVNYKYDPDRLYLKFNNDREFALIQFFVFGKILQNYGYFQAQNTVKK